MGDPLWIDMKFTLQVHNRQLAEHGGADGVRDEGLLESALSRPRQAFAYGDPTPTIPQLAAGYANGISRNHPFIDGNKRTTYVVCRTFLVLNGFDMTATLEERYLTFLSLAAGEMSEAELAAWLTAHTAKL